MIGTPASRATASSAGMSAHSPYRCTGRMAFVRGVRARATAAGSTLKVSGSISTNTGVAPTRLTQPAVAKNENVGVMTSSPAPMPSAISTTSSASVPDETAMASSTPIMAASSRSRPSTSGPLMNRWLSQTRVMAARISARSGRYCAARSSSGTWRWRSEREVASGTIRELYPSRLDRGAGLTLDLAAFDRFALVEGLLALGQRDRQLQLAFLEVHPERHDGQAALGGLAEEFVEFGRAEEQLSLAQRIVARVSAVAVLPDVRVE